MPHCLVSIENPSQIDACIWRTTNTFSSINRPNGIPAAGKFYITIVAVPRITCSSITADMCTSLKWKDIITQDCPNVCGFCQEGTRIMLQQLIFDRIFDTMVKEIWLVKKFVCSIEYGIRFRRMCGFSTRLCKRCLYLSKCGHAAVCQGCFVVVAPQILWLCRRHTLEIFPSLG